MRRLPVAKVYNPFVYFAGGLDLSTPPLVADPGTVRGSQNVYQGDNGGYYTVSGYEPYDGTTAPSVSTYSFLSVAFTASVAVDDILTGASASGKVIYVGNNYAVLVDVTGTYGNEVVSVSGSAVGTCDGPQKVNNSPSALLGATFSSLKTISRSADITAIPGSGDVLGIWKHNGVRYGFRNDITGTLVEMYKATSSGWSKVVLGFELSFTSGGTYVPKEGDILTGATSGATATITRVALETNTFSAGTAEGRFIFAAKTGTFVSETLNVSGNVDIATVAGDAVAIAFSNPGGKFKFVNGNFTGSKDTLRMYGVDGANRGFEFDGTVFVPIKTGMEYDYPENVFIHKNHLFYSFLASVQHSSPGFPYQWSVVVDAGEIGIGDPVTSFAALPGSGTGSALLITSQKSSRVLYGSSVADWNLVAYDNEVGAIDGTVQKVGSTFFLSTQGVFKLAMSQVYGNFDGGTVTQKVKTWFKTKINQVAGSCVIREKNLYIMFFNDKSAMCCTIKDGNVIASMPLSLNHKVTCIYSIDDSGEEIMFGSTDGKVRHLFSGSGFDGEVVEWFVNLHYNNLGSPMINKRFRGGNLEISGAGYSNFVFGYQVDYGTTTRAQYIPETKETSLASVNWDDFVWGEFTWDGSGLIDSNFDMTGEGPNFSLMLSSNEQSYNPLEFSGAIIQYTPTRGKR